MSPEERADDFPLQPEPGVLSCPDCTRQRELRFTWEKRFWRTSHMLVAATLSRAQQNVPGTGRTWAEMFTRVTGIEWQQAEASYQRAREAAAERRGARE